jgi:hypothetical protein
VVADNIENVIMEGLNGTHVQCTSRCQRITLKQTNAIGILTVEADVVTQNKCLTAAVPIPDLRIVLRFTLDISSHSTTIFLKGFFTKSVSDIA